MLSEAQRCKREYTCHAGAPARTVGWPLDVVVIQMNGDAAIYAFVKTVEGIMHVERENMFARTNNDKYICFSPNGFRTALRYVIVSESLEDRLEARSSNPEKIVRELLQVFRTLGLIVCNNDKGFTSTQRINGTLRRTITVDAGKYELLKELQWHL